VRTTTLRPPTSDVSFRPRLLVSVRSANEVVAAVEGGADWIDLKEPLVGPLGAVDAKVARRIVEQVAGLRPISAALGELVDWEDSSSRSLLDIEEIAVVKLGLAGCSARPGWQSQWQAAAKMVRDAGKTLVAVVYADCRQAQSPTPQEVIAFTQALKCRYLLIDTFEKQTGSVFEHISNSHLQDILQLAKAASLQTVVAGSLTHSSLAKLPNSGIDLVAVRGAVCDGERTESIRQELVADFKMAMAHRWPKSRSHSPIVP